MLGLDPEIGTSALRLWMAAGAAALLVVLVGFAFARPRAEGSGSTAVRAIFVIVGAVLGAAVTWAFLDHAALDGRGADRRALEQRAGDLAARSLAPGSPLACLDAVSGDGVEAACEKALLASPAAVAAASSYTAARLALLASMGRYAERGGRDIDYLMQPLRQSLELDRFGFVAHLLAVRDGCTGQNCKALAALRDASRVRANLSAQTLDHYLERYQEIWAKAPDETPAETGQIQANASAAPNAPPRRPVNIDFPSAASIPPVSIMNPEPNGPVLPGVAAAAAANPNPPQAAAAATRRSRKQTNAAPQTAAQPAPGAPATEPIWPEPVPMAPPQTAATPAGAPVQLSPPPPSANAGTPVRSQ